MPTDNPFWLNSTDLDPTNDQPRWWTTYAECPLLNIETQTNRVRLVFEVIQLVGAFLYIAAALREMRFLGYNMFIENLVMRLSSQIELVFLFVVSFRVANWEHFKFVNIDDSPVACNVSVLVLSNDDNSTIAFTMSNRVGGSRLCCDHAHNSPIFPIFLQVCRKKKHISNHMFYAPNKPSLHILLPYPESTSLQSRRGFKTVGPFVVMIYRMVMGDLIRFVSIYLVFVMGFAQAYYIIFLSFDSPASTEGTDDPENPVPSPMESIVAMFLMSLTNFGDYYGTMEHTNHELEGKILFVVFMVIVAVLLVNMLIAMMGNTYQKIAETRNEWQRQWARIVLVVERGVAPAERLKNFNNYSQPMSDGRRALVLRLNMNVS